MNRTFSAPMCLLADEPRALPWADIIDAVGVANASVSRVDAPGSFWSSLFRLHFTPTACFIPAQATPWVQADLISSRPKACFIIHPIRVGEAAAIFRRSEL